MLDLVESHRITTGPVMDISVRQRCTPPLTQSNFFHFNAVVGNILAK